MNSHFSNYEVQMTDTWKMFIKEIHKLQWENMSLQSESLSLKGNKQKKCWQGLEEKKHTFMMDK